MVPDPATKHNDPEPDPFVAKLQKWAPVQLWHFYNSMEDVIHSEVASPALLMIRNEIRKIIRPYLPVEAWTETSDFSEQDTLLCVHEEVAEEVAASDEPEPESPPPEETWQQEYHHPQRPPSAPAAPTPQEKSPPSPFIDRVLCFYCEKFFWGQLLIRTATCPLCGQATLRQVGTSDLRHDPWFPFHPQGGAA